MLNGLFESAGLNPPTATFDLPQFAAKERKPYIVIRPATIRTEWIASARNPDPKYLCEAAEILKKDFDIISVADLDGSAEFAVNPLPFATHSFHKGELNVEQLMALVQNASGVVGGVGWILPAAMAYRTPMLLIYGGWGRINGAQHVLDHRIDQSKLHQAHPDKFCMCNDRMHLCDRTITDFSTHVEHFKKDFLNAPVTQ
jgi:ADP-heptose:LPS heptosyltransferase